ncbi:glycosyltransferase family 2 protein [Knoellia sp. Soil729]|uniref:glycosyltransferase family 2 protein n=1 Tax=Knoellia sp. Soil729 TaxID=1736394 RepID=UPI000A563584|nr:glycosyltransferase family 2 protein [Knoellia sp. Soil729]
MTRATAERPFATRTPKVSYVLPVLNDAAALHKAITSVLAQDYPGEQEVVVAVAPSHDGTRAVAEEHSRDDPRVRVVDNPDTDIPAGLNRAVAAADGEVIVRVDAHSELPPGYTRRMVETLRRTGAANVGGVMLARGSSGLQASVARAYNSGLGLGGGAYHAGTEEGPGESAYLGVFRRSDIEPLGWYDESLRRGEDYELNQRILAAGHLIWFVPDVQVEYRPRAGWGSLARQMYATGVWRAEMVRRARSTPPRYLAAPLVVGGLGASLAVGAAQLAGAPRWPWSVVHTGPIAYAAFLAYAGQAMGGQSASERVRDAAAVATIHLTWGAGFLKGLALGAGATVDRSRVSRGAGRALGQR